MPKKRFKRAELTPEALQQRETEALLPDQVWERRQQYRSQHPPTYDEATDGWVCGNTKCPRTWAGAPRLKKLHYRMWFGEGSK
jgi:hypothetical protein